jgi:hypothetical protein
VQFFRDRHSATLPVRRGVLPVGRRLSATGGNQPSDMNRAHPESFCVMAPTTRETRHTPSLTTSTLSEMTPFMTKTRRGGARNAEHR